MAKKKNKSKKMSKASLNFDNKHAKNLDIKAEYKLKTELKQMIFRVAGVNKYDEIDELICRPNGYSERILKYGSIGRGYELYEDIINFCGIAEVRSVFRAWLKGMNLTMASVSKILFPDKSQSYLATILNEDNKSTYSDEFVNDAFLKCKDFVSEGVIKINGHTLQDKALLIADKLKDDSDSKKEVKDKKTKPIEVQSPKGIERNDKKVMITNFDKKKQVIFNFDKSTLKELDDFYKVLKQVEAITDNVAILPIF